MKLRDEIALISGASSGIGRGVAIAFGAEGARVAVNYPDSQQQQKAEGVCAEIEAAGGSAIAVMADISEESEVDAMIESVREQFGDVSLLVNNAGIAHTAPLAEIPVATWDRLFGVHVRGTFLITRRVLPSMYQKKRGCIINTVSQLAYKGAPGLTHYTAAKGALISLTRSLSLEASSHNVNVNCVAPGATRTPILEAVPAELMDQVRAAIPLGRIAEVDDIVPTYVMLASRDGRHYQGQCLSPNGGDVFL